MTSIVVKCTIATNLFRTTWREIIIFTMLYIIVFQFIIKRNVELQCRQVVWKNVRPGGWFFVNYHRIYLTNSTLWQGHHVSSCQVIWNNIATLLFCRDTDIAASKNASQLLNSGCAARLGAATRNYNQHHVDQNATQASEGGTQDANCGAPERTRPTYWRCLVTEYANIRRHPRYISTESEKCPVERPMTGQNTHFEQLIR